MKIFIQARKGGYNVLFPKPTPYEFYHFASDLQSISARNDAIYYGINFYTLAFSSGGCIYTKYVIGYDIQRNNLGNIGISVFIPHDQRMLGNDLKMLLDKLLNQYCSAYCPDYQIDDKNEDWSLFTSIADNYDVKLLTSPSENEVISTGTQDPAFHYYKSDTELIEHLDKPFQVEYSDYKQIIFVDFYLKDNGNPLNILKNSGIEVNPDLKNNYYYLNNSSAIKDLIITANGKRIFDGKGNNKIRAKWQVKINYSKDDRCYEPINESGTLSDTESEIFKYLEIKGSNVLLKKEALEKKKVKSVLFEIKDFKENTVSDAEIKIGTRDWIKVIESSISVDFCGEEIIQNWRILARKESENLQLNDFFVNPYEKNESVVLNLQKQLVVRFFALDEENANGIKNFKIYRNGEKINYINESEIVFKNDEIYAKWNIEVSKNEGQFTFMGKIQYCPSNDGNQINILCQKSLIAQSPNKIYSIDAGAHGKRTKNCPDYANGKSDLSSTFIEAKKGFIFDNWSLENDTFVAKYKPKSSKKRFRIIVCIVFVLSIVSFFWFLQKSKVSNFPPNQLKQEEITKYLEGNDIKIDNLNNYKKQLDSLTQALKTQSDFGWLDGFFADKMPSEDSEIGSRWQSIYESLERGIKKRELINDNNFLELKKKEYHFSELQQRFKMAIQKIDSSNFSKVSSQIGDISALSLSQIADSISKILKSNETDSPMLTIDKVEAPQTRKDTAINKQGTGTSSKGVNEAIIQTNEQDDKIISIIKGSNFTRNDLKNYNDQSTNPIVKKSISLCLKFWIIDKDKIPSYCSYLDELKNDKYLKSSELNHFVDEICKNGQFEFIPAVELNKMLLSNIIKKLK